MKPRHLWSALAVAACLLGGHSSASAQSFFAVLNGGNEVTNAGQANQGDPDGYGTGHVMFAGAGRLCFGISVLRIAKPTAAHIHEAVAGKNGPIVVNLTPPAAGNPGASSGCVTGVAAAVLTRLRNTPGNFYINVHNGQFPSGAIRGQLF